MTATIIADILMPNSFVHVRAVFYFIAFPGTWNSKKC